MNRRLRRGALVAGALVTVAAIAGAFQFTTKAPPPITETSAVGTVDFWTKIGSFKIASPDTNIKARGKITMSFQGTVLVVGLEGSAIPGPGVKVQYDDAKHARKVYFGRGTLTVDGKWRAMQFFGRDFKGSWTGMGIMRMYGEFDDKLDTGTYIVKGRPKEAWGNGGRQITLPPAPLPTDVKPKIEDVKPGKGG